MDEPQNENLGLFMLDLLCTFAAIGLLGFSIYILPYVFTGDPYYDVPLFILHMNDWYLEKGIDGISLMIGMFAPFIGGAIGFFSLAKFISTYIQRLEHKKNQIRVKNASESKSAMNEREGMVAAMRGSIVMFLIIIALMIVLLCIEFLFLPPPF